MPLRVLALPYGHALSHVSRPLRLAEELRQRGHEVAFAGGGKELVWAERRGFPVVPAEELPHEVLFGRIRARKLRFIEEDELKTLVEADLDVFAEVKPHLVLTDGRISARLSTRHAGLKHAALVNVSSARHRAIPYVPLFEWVRPGWLRAPLRRFNLWFEMAVFDRAVPAFRRVAQSLGIPPTVTATDCLEGNDLTLLPDLPEFMPSRRLPPSHHYIGPLTFRADLPDPPWWPELLRLKAEGRKIVYFTLGTTGTRELFDEVLPALAQQAGWAAVVTTGGQLDPPSPWSNVFVAPYLDGDRVMAVADLVVCHGGNGTIYQAMAHGVPVVGMPTIPDQEYNMRCCKALGAGFRWQGPWGSESLSQLTGWSGRHALPAGGESPSPRPCLGEAVGLLEALGNIGQGRTPCAA